MSSCYEQKPNAVAKILKTNREASNLAYHPKYNAITEVYVCNTTWSKYILKKIDQQLLFPKSHISLLKIHHLHFSRYPKSNL